MLDALERNPDGVIVIRRDGIIGYANPAAERLIGRPDRPLVGGPFGIPTVAGGAAVLDLAPTPGDPRVAEMRVSEIQWGGEPAFLAFFRDITGYERLREEVDRLGREATESERRNHEFLAKLAHELRNPLMPILNGLRLMRLVEDDEAARDEAQEMVERQVRNVARVLEDLLSSARDRRGGISVRLEPADLADLAARAAAASRPAAEARGQRLSARAEGRLPVEADPTWLEQSLAHLLQNAIKYTPPGGSIELVARREGGEAVAEVRDDGVGIAAEMLPKVFELFEQEGRSKGRSEGGMGIGLAVVREVVERHGGAVAASSPGPGLGSTFAIRLPLVPGQPPEEEASEAECQASRLRVMIVDDNRASALSLESLVKCWGHEACAAADAATGLDVARTYRPQVVLLDMNLPGIDGLEAARRFRSRPETADARLVAVTGDDLDGPAGPPGGWRHAGFDDYLRKPLDIDALGRLLGDAAQAN